MGGLALVGAKLSLVGAMMLWGGMVGGCGFMEMTKERPIPPKYTGLKAQSIGVMVWCDRTVRLDYPAIQLDVANAIQRNLQQSAERDKKGELTDAKFPVQPRSIVRFQYENPDTDAAPITVTAPKLGVERLIYVEIEEFYTRPDAQLALFRGTVTATLRVVEVVDGKATVAYVENDLRTLFPPDAPAEGLPGSDDFRVYQATINAFAKEVTHRFITHTLEDKE